MRKVKTFAFLAVKIFSHRQGHEGRKKRRAATESVFGNSKKTGNFAFYIQHF